LSIILQLVATGWYKLKKFLRPVSRPAARHAMPVRRVIRRLLATPGDLAQQLTRLAETVELHDDQIRAIADVLKKMMSSPVPPEIGFHTIRRPGQDGTKES
jgi:hypothetical protein